MNRKIRKLIRESVRRILLEKIHGNLAIVYHNSPTPPLELATYMNTGYLPGGGGGSVYGRGLYTVYVDEKDLPNTKSGQGFYGNYLYKIRVDLTGFLIFDPEPCIKVHGKSLTLRQQLEKLNLKNIIKQIENTDVEKRKGLLDADLATYKESRKGLSSDGPHDLKRFFVNNVNGVVFTGPHDGEVVVAYDPDRSAYLLGHKEKKEGEDFPAEFKNDFEGGGPEWTEMSRKRVALQNTQAGTFADLNARDIKFDDGIAKDFSVKLINMIETDGINEKSLANLEKVINQMSKVDEDAYHPKQLSKKLREAFVKEIIKKDPVNILRILSVENAPEILIDTVVNDYIWPPEIVSYFDNLSVPEFNLYISEYAKLVKQKYDPSKSYKIIENVIYILNKIKYNMTIDTLEKAEATYKSSGGPQREANKNIFVGLVERYLQGNSKLSPFDEKKYPTADHIAQLIKQEAEHFLKILPKVYGKYGVEFFYAQKLLDFRSIRYSSLRNGENMINSDKDLQKICFFLMRHNIFSSNIVQQILMGDIGKPRTGSGFNPRTDDF